VRKDAAVAITGATGFVAKNLRRRLAKSHRLVSLSRKAFRPLRNEEAVATDYSDSAALRRVLQDCDVLIHLVGAGERVAGPSYDAVNAGITSAVVEAAKPKVRQIVFLSGLGASSGSTSEYFRSKFKAERIIRDSGIGFTVFRPSFIIGRNDYLTRSLNRQIRRGPAVIPGNGRYVIQPILISDAVRIVEDSVLNPRFLNKTFDLVGPEEIAFEKYVRLFCKTKGADISRMPLETCLRNALGGRPPYSLDDLSIFYGGYRGDFGRLQRAFCGPIGRVGDRL